MKRLGLFLLLATLCINNANSQGFKKFRNALKDAFNTETQGGTQNRNERDENSHDSDNEQQVIYSSKGMSLAERTARNSTPKELSLVEKINLLNKGLPKITGKPLPEVQGWTLVRSNTIAGFKCDHYEKGNRALRVFRKDNGDFMTLNEDPDGLSREPFTTSNSTSFMYGDTTTNCPIGEYRLTTDEGIIINGNFKDFYIDGISPWGGGNPKRNWCRSMKLTFPNGDAISVKQGEMASSGMGMQPEESSPANWDNFKSGKKKFTFSYQFDPIWLYLKEEPEKRHPYLWEIGYLIGTRAYVWDKEAMTILAPIYQFVKDNHYYANESDSIVAVVKKTVNVKDNLVPNLYTSEEVTYLKYANGDSIVFRDGEIRGGKIHRPCGLVTFKKKGEKVTCRINYPDGKIFAGRVAGTIPGTGNVITDNSSFSILSADDLRPWTGTFEYPDGTLTNLTGGKTDKQLAEERAAQEAEYEKARKAREAAEKQERQALNNKYGKRYVDIAYAKKLPVVGMPIELVKLFYDVRLYSSSSYSDIYHLYDARFSMNSTNYSSYEWRMSLFVRNGRITSYNKWW